MPNSSEHELTDTEILNLSDTEEEMLTMPGERNPAPAAADDKPSIEDARKLYNLMLMPLPWDSKQNLLDQLLDKTPALLHEPYFGRTPLMLACEIPSYELADYLIRRGADVHQTLEEFIRTGDYTGHQVQVNALFCAVTPHRSHLQAEIRSALADYNLDRQITQLLLAHGVDITQLFYNKNLLHLIAEYEDPAQAYIQHAFLINKIMTEHPDMINQTIAGKNTPLATAQIYAQNRYSPLLHLLLSCGSNPHLPAHTNVGQRELLYLAAVYQLPGLMETLMLKGVSIKKTLQFCKKELPAIYYDNERILSLQERCINLIMQVKAKVQHHSHTMATRKNGQAVRKVCEQLETVQHREKQKHFSLFHARPSQAEVTSALTKLGVKLVAQPKASYKPGIFSRAAKDDSAFTAKEVQILKSHHLEKGLRLVTLKR